MRTFVLSSLLVCSIVYSIKSFGQNCPACSNPAIQAGEKIEAGMDSLQKGFFRITLNAIAGLNFIGGHLNTRGVYSDSENGIATIKDTVVALHNHVVDLDFYRLRLNFEYTFSPNWSAWLRMPFDIKVQSSTIDWIDTVDYTDFDKDAARLNKKLHHRTEILTGFFDFELFAAHRFIDLFGKRDRLEVAFGVSLPVGHTEENPFEARERGEKHTHIQFGSGTFNPLLELHYSKIFGTSTMIGFFTMSKFPFYQSKKTYRSPVESTTGLSISDVFLKKFVLHANIMQVYMSFAYWDGDKDPNSGLIATTGMVSATYFFKNGLLANLGFRYPLYQKTLSKEGDTFKFGPTFLLTVSHMFNTRRL